MFCGPNRKITSRAIDRSQVGRLILTLKRHADCEKVVEKWKVRNSKLKEV